MDRRSEGPPRRTAWSRLRGASLAAAVAAISLLLVGAPSAAFEPPPEPVVTGRPQVWPDAPSVDAEAFLLVDAGTGQVLAAHREDRRRPVASTIKVLTVLTATARVAPDEQVTVGDEVLVGGASVGLAPGDTWSVEELVHALIARSGNDAAHALATYVAGDADTFAELMAQDLAEMGVMGAVVDDTSGLTDTNLLSAQDLAVVARVALEDDQLRPVLAARTVTLPGLGEVESRNLLLGSYPGATGIKTGFTMAAGNSLIASARRGERELIAVVLGGGEDPARFDAAAALLDHGFEAFATVQLAAEVVFLGARDDVVVAVPTVELLVPLGHEPQLRLPLLARPPDDLDEVAIEIAGTPVGVAAATLERPETAVPDRGTVAIGHGLVDGVYAALRADAAAGSLR